jgi:uncharacterized protein DUF6812
VSLSERTHSVAARLPDRPRDLQEVALMMVDGTEIRGVLHRAHGTRTLDYLNRQAEGFVAMTDAELVRDGRTELVAFLAINKAHILRLIEANDDL